MRQKLRYSSYIVILLFCSLGACIDEVPDGIEEVTELTPMTLKLNIQKESVVQTRANDVPDDTDKIESLDFFIFNKDGDIVLHEQPALRWTGTEYQMTVNIPTAKNEHSLYLVANHLMPKGTILRLQDLEQQICTTAGAIVTPPFVMATKKIKLVNLNSITIKNAMNSDGNNAFILQRNVAKFSVEVSAINFKLKSVEWVNCPETATILLEGNYISTSTHSFSSLASPSLPIYLYQIQDMGVDSHKGFYIVVYGEYEAKNGTKVNGYYKLRMNTLNSTGNDKIPLTSIDGNSYYKVSILSVSGAGFSSLELAKKNGFSNEMEALVNLEYAGTHEYRETFSQNGYQLGLESSHWRIYSNETLGKYTLGYFYRCIRNASLSNNTTFDPDYPNKKRSVFVARQGSEEIIESTDVKDGLNTPIEMELCFSDIQGMAGQEYVLTSVIQYGIIQTPITVERYPSITKEYRVIPMLRTNLGEVTGNVSWIGIAEQRHEGATLYQQISSENEQIFIHILENNTGQPREGIVYLFGLDGFYEMHIRQEG